MTTFVYVNCVIVIGPEHHNNNNNEITDITKYKYCNINIYYKSQRIRLSI